MAVNKTLTVDLSKLTQESAKNLVSDFDEIIQKTTQKQTQKQKTIPKAKKEETLKKIFGKKTFTTLVSAGSNPLSFVQGQVTKLIPFIGTALLITGVIAAFVVRVDNFQKAFVDNVDARIDVFRSKQQQAEIQAGLQQVILTSAAGSAEPRDAYNTFQVFNTDQSRIEADFRLRDNSGVD